MFSFISCSTHNDCSGQWTLTKTEVCTREQSIALTNLRLTDGMRTSGFELEKQLNALSRASGPFKQEHDRQYRWSFGLWGMNSKSLRGKLY